MARRRKSRRKMAPRKKIERPLGVTVISILSWISAFASIVIGLLIVAVGIVGGVIPLIGLAVTSLGVLIGTIFILIGIVVATVTYWLWKLERRGWRWVMVFTLIQLVFGAFGGNILSVALSLIILVYLWMKRDIFK